MRPSRNVKNIRLRNCPWNGSKHSNSEWPRWDSRERIKEKMEHGGLWKVTDRYEKGGLRAFQRLKMWKEGVVVLANILFHIKFISIMKLK